MIWIDGFGRHPFGESGFVSMDREVRSFLMVVARGWWGDVHLGCALSCLPNSCD